MEKLSLPYYKGYKKLHFQDNNKEQFSIKETKRCKLMQTQQKQKLSLKILPIDNM